jgi:hypothetical protein
VFADGDSTRLYRATGQGLLFSSDGGDTWEQAAGVIGQVQTTALSYADTDGHTIIYAATTGGQASTTGGAGARSRGAAAKASRMVDAGIYRYVVVKPTLTLKLSGLSAGVLKLGRRVTAKGVVTPTALTGSKVTLTLQRRQNGTWRKVKTVTQKIGAGGTYSWTYKATRSAGYRLRATIQQTATHLAARTMWYAFKVR